MQLIRVIRTIIHGIRTVLYLTNRQTKDISLINKTYLCFLPKKKNARKVPDYCSIGLCNSIYTIISRAIFSRLEKVKHLIINEAQRVFISGRLIAGCSTIAYEVFHCMQHPTASSQDHMALKLYLAKVLTESSGASCGECWKKILFPSRFINIIVQCVSTTQLSALVNGQPTGFFQPLCGIRQGDPLSPFLCIICAAGLSSLLNSAINRQVLHGFCFTNPSPCISHLFSADDSLLFLDSTHASAKAIKEVLESYSRLSRQLINYDKSPAFFSGKTSQAFATSICITLGMLQGDSKGRYLGLPFMIGHSKKEVFGFVEDR